MKDMKIVFALVVISVMAMGLGSANAALFEPDFESYTTGSVDGQDGWVAFAALGGVHPDDNAWDAVLADVQETENSGQFMPGNKYLAVSQIGNIESQNKHRNGLYRPFTPTAQVHLEVLYSPRQSNTSWRSISLRDSSDAEYATVAAMVGSSKNYGSGLREFFVVSDGTGDNRVWYYTGTDIVPDAHYKIVIDADATTQTYDATVNLFDIGTMTVGAEVASWSDVNFSRTTGGTLSRVYIQSWDSQSDWDHLLIEDPSAGIPGDFDEDNDVDGVDFGKWQAGYPMASGASLGDGDADGDGDVDGVDFGIWQENYPTNLGSAATIPEPATLALLLVGGLAILRSRR